MFCLLLIRVARSVFASIPPPTTHTLYWQRIPQHRASPRFYVRGLVGVSQRVHHRVVILTTSIHTAPLFYGHNRRTLHTPRIPPSWRAALGGRTSFRGARSGGVIVLKAHGCGVSGLAATPPSSSKQSSAQKNPFHTNNNNKEAIKGQSLPCTLLLHR